MIINTMKLGDDMELEEHRAEVFDGELEIEPNGEYIVKMSIIGEGFNHPICDIPFSPMVGYYKWISPLTDNDKLEEVEQNIIDNVDQE